jgi:hypothetical protein
MLISRNRLLRPSALVLLWVLSLAAAELCLAKSPLLQAPGETDNQKSDEPEEKDKNKKDKKHHEKPYALIFGTVWAPDKRPVYGVKVKCRRANEKKVRWELYSDHSGEFAIRVPAGKLDYVVFADLKGFKSLDGKHFQAPPEVTVHIENDERTDIGLHLK